MPGTAYVAVDGHRSDDLKPLRLRARATTARAFESITQRPAGVRQRAGHSRGSEEQGLCSTSGTEFGLFVSLDAGKSWQKFMNNYPTVRTDDILVHPRDNDLIVATHGRSVLIADDITPLQQLDAGGAQAQDATLFDIRPAVAWLNDQQHGPAGRRADGMFVGENAPRGARDQLLPEVGGRRRRQDLDRRRHRAASIRTLGRRRDRRASTACSESRAECPAQGQQGGGFGGGRGGAQPVVEPGIDIVTLNAAGKTLVKPVTVLQ